MKSREKSCVTTGSFDGVHRGHQLVVGELAERAAELGYKPLVVTFDPHPLSVVRPGQEPKLLLLPEERVARLRAMGVETHLLEFTDRIRMMTALEWVEHLRSEYGAELILIGFDNRFGRDGVCMGDPQFHAMVRGRGVEVAEAPCLAGVSSSAIRAAISAGDMEAACKMLGYRWSLPGTVAPGRAEGRKLGFPTANLRVDPRLLLPGNGVYASMVEMPDGTRMPAVTNVGCRPSFDNGEVTVETHIPGFSGDLYDRNLRVLPLRKLRDERRFPSVGLLKEQIEKDTAMAVDHFRHLPLSGS